MFAAFLAAFTILVCMPLVYIGTKVEMPTLFKFVYFAVIVLVAGMTIIQGRHLG